MTDVPLSQACPELVIDLGPDDHITDVVAFVSVTDASSGKLNIHVVTTAPYEVAARGMVAVGTEIMLKDFARGGP